MGYKLERAMTRTSPYVLMDREKGVLRLEGVCFLEDVPEFFREIIDWLERYLESDTAKLTFDCDMPYFNSSTTKQLYDMLMLLDKHSTGSRKVVVNWIYDADDDIAIELGEDFRDDTKNLTFNLVEK